MSEARNTDLSQVLFDVEEKDIFMKMGPNGYAALKYDYRLCEPATTVYFTRRYGRQPANAQRRMD